VEKHREAILFLNYPIKFHFNAMNVYFSILLLIGLFITPNNIYSMETIEEIQEGNRLYDQGNYKKALLHFLQAKQQNPNSSKALLGYGKTSLALGSIPDARVSFEKCLKLVSNDPEAIAGLGRVLVQENKFTDSRNYLEAALKKTNNNPIINLALAETFQAMGKPELAIHKLETLSRKINLDYDLQERLAYLYLTTHQLDKVNGISESLINKNPEKYNGFFIKGKYYTILSYDSDPSSKESYSSYQKGLSAYENALTLSPENQEIIYWKAKLLIWKGKDERKEAISLLKQILKSNPKNYEVMLSLASILSEQTALSSEDTQLAIDLWKSSLQSKDTDEIIRFGAENFTIKHLPEESPLRKSLGKYRIERHKSEMNSLYYESSLFHLLRANDLSPHSPETESLLENYYYKTNDFTAYINTLIRLVKEDPNNFKLQNRLEKSVLSSKKNLEYKEGYLFPEGPGLGFINPSTSPKVLLMDLTPKAGIQSHISSGHIIQSALKRLLSNTEGIRLVSEQEEQSIRTLLESRNKSSWNPYHSSIHFEINESSLYGSDIRFIVFGKLNEDENSLQVELQSYDRLTGKYSDLIKIRGKGRGSLSYITSAFAAKFKKLYPIEGEILKIKNNGVIVNLGKRNGLNSKSIVEFYRGSKSLGSSKILELGDYISLVHPELKDWERVFATGEKVKVKKP
jgi:cytochrome c-type biogenesis protein CcmH/NrfG